MISTIQIDNFQSHQNTILELDPGVNAITGASDSGKSAIIRALLWNFDNRPLGDAFCSWFAGKKPTSVGVEFAEGTYVIKERKNGKNSYNLNGTKFEALKSDVPEDLATLVNLADYNISSQHSPYFLLQETGGEVARRFNELIGLDIIDRTFSKLDSIIRDSKGKIADCSNEIKDLEVQIAQYVSLNEIEAILKKAVSDIDTKEKVAQRCSQLMESLNSLQSLEEEISLLLIDEQLEKDVARLKQLISDFEAKDAISKKLFNAIESIEETEGNLETWNSWLEIEGEQKAVKSLIDSYRGKSEREKKIFQALVSIENLNKEIEETEKACDRLSGQHLNLLSKVKKCPVCQEPVTNNSLKCIREHFK